jgi:hypothetical protein
MRRVGETSMVVQNSQMLYQNRLQERATDLTSTVNLRDVVEVTPCLKVYMKPEALTIIFQAWRNSIFNTHGLHVKGRVVDGIRTDPGPGVQASSSKALKLENGLPSS